MNGPIDIVVTWVDEKDPGWLAEKKRCLERRGAEAGSDSNIRFESWDNLQYWFRAIEKFMPWFHQIILITCGQIPEFLKVSHPKLRIIKHSDYIPEEYLPTFNSNTIEMNVHRIQQLSENFILFNDDLFPLRPIEETYYFKDDQVCDEAVENIIAAAVYGPVANLSVR